MYLWRWENNFWESVFSFHHVGKMRTEFRPSGLAASVFTHRAASLTPPLWFQSSQVNGTNLLRSFIVVITNHRAFIFLKYLIPISIKQNHCPSLPSPVTMDTTLICVSMNLTLLTWAEPFTICSSVTGWFETPSCFYSLPMLQHASEFPPFLMLSGFPLFV